ncbi:hypothetical protein GMST_25450 [Geomonas silvestris]|uniref:Uncharacterized protein n=1 Tax=Geomonas silvestris TaxID=2740184 RepID=A0A6V8MJQ2_9BACT|nr:hypothetical protein [Geomonas silvestris]GFO60220.1 hypothetical protein GMST_25450 [Geomonas silvestris]
MAQDQGNPADKLRAACQAAFQKYPDSCSTAVWHVIRQYRPSQPYLMANDLLDALGSSPDWQEVPLNHVSTVANEGGVVVGGLKEPGHGHVAVVYPGEEKLNGGFTYISKKTGKPVEAAATGTYPLAMSTTMGAWPGAKSNGDKTVRDPWPAEKFKAVQFWRYIGSVGAASSPPRTKERWTMKSQRGLAYSKGCERHGNIKRWQAEEDSLRLSPGRPSNVIRWVR